MFCETYQILSCKVKIKYRSQELHISYKGINIHFYTHHNYNTLNHKFVILKGIKRSKTIDTN